MHDNNKNLNTLRPIQLQENTDKCMDFFSKKEKYSTYWFINKNIHKSLFGINLC